MIADQGKSKHLGADFPGLHRFVPVPSSMIEVVHISISGVISGMEPRLRRTGVEMQSEALVKVTRYDRKPGAARNECRDP